MYLTPQIEYQNKNWSLFNTYNYLKIAKQDAKEITRFKTIILKSNSKIDKYFLYQEVI